MHYRNRTPCILLAAILTYHPGSCYNMLLLGLIFIPLGYAYCCVPEIQQVLTASMNGYRENDEKQEYMKKEKSPMSYLAFYGPVARFFVVFGIGFALLSEFGNRKIQEIFPFIHQLVHTHTLKGDGLHGFLLEQWPLILKALCYGIYIKWFASKLMDHISAARKVRLWCRL